MIRDGGTPIYWRWAALAVLLPIELMVLSIRFDSAPLTGLLGNVGLVARLGVPIVAAILIFGGHRVLEFGSGWGAMAIAAAKIGCVVDTITLSLRQKELAEHMYDKGF